MKWHGYTLIEMLVVLVVAGILISVVTLNLMPTAQTQLREEARRLAFLLENSAFSAQAGGQELAWSGSGQHYRFWQRGQEGEWLRIDHDPLLRPHTLPDSIRIQEVQSNGRRIEPGGLILLSPETVLQPFRITLISDGRIATLSSSGLGQVKVEEASLP